MRASPAARSRRQRACLAKSGFIPARNGKVSICRRHTSNEGVLEMAITIRVELPQHLRTLAHVGHEVEIQVEGPVTQRAVLDAVEAAYPMLKGAIRDHVTKQRRAFLRFFACQEDLTHESPDAPLPQAVVSGKEPFLIIGAIGGGV